MHWLNAGRFLLNMDLTLGNTHGPGYPSPMDAMINGPRETLLYVITVNPDLDNEDGDYLSTIDADPTSKTYSQVIHRTYTKRKGNLVLRMNQHLILLNRDRTVIHILTL